MLGFCMNFLYRFGGGNFMPFIGLIFWIIILVIIGLSIYFIIKMALKNNSPEPAIEILRKKYVKGEITKEEFDAKKKDL